MLKFIHCNDSSSSELDKYRSSENTYYVCPSFIDLQVNGYGGISLDHDVGVTAEKLEHISRSLKDSGCAVFVPTLITSPYERLKSSLEETSAFMRSHPGAVPGLHIEGPFISMAKKGIHNESYIRKLEGRDLELLLSHADAVAYVTLDPEAITEDNLRLLTSAGIKVSLGHTSADYDTACRFIANGATLGTHLYNAMTMAGNGRTPKAAEAILNSDSVYCGVIGDGIHVHYGLVRLAHKMLGDRFVLVTDCLAAAGTDPHVFKEFIFAEKKIFNDPEKGCIDAGGTLGGSRLTMAEGVRNLILHAGFSVDDAVFAAAVAPARALGIAVPESLNILDGDYRLVGTVSA